MSFEVWTGKPDFDHPHEEEAAERAIHALEELYGESRDFCFLVLNFHCGGEDFDALVLKRKAILIIDFKDCNKPVVGGANGNWHVKGDSSAVLNEGRRNPYQQVRDYRYALMRYLDEHRSSFLSPQKASQASFEHVSSVVCITPDKHPDSEFDIDFGKERWFRVVGLPELADLVKRERSPQISLNKTEARKFVKDVLHCVPQAAGEEVIPAEDRKILSQEKEKKMPYTAQISRANPSCFLFLIDQSYSMIDPFGASEIETSKAKILADIINRLLDTIVDRCAKDEGIWRYFQVGVIGYGATVGPSFGGELAGQELAWIDDIGDHPLCVEDRLRKVYDGAGGLVEVTDKVRVWLNPVADDGTPMCQALWQAHTILQDWVAQRTEAFPPVVINITDGESTDGDPYPASEALRELGTEDGNLLLLNLHLSSRRGPELHFPDSEDGLPDEYARLLFRMSSPLPDDMRVMARKNYNVSDTARGFVFNADVKDVIQFLEIGTSGTSMR